MLNMTNLTKVYRTHMIETHALRGFDIARQARASSSPSPAPRVRARPPSSTSPACSRNSPAASYLLDGVNVKGLDDDARSRLRNEKIGFIFQGFNLIPDLNLFDNVDVPLRYRGFNAAERKQRIEDALGKVGLASRMKHYPGRTLRRPAAARGDRPRAGRLARACCWPTNRPATSTRRWRAA